MFDEESIVVTIDSSDAERGGDDVIRKLDEIKKKSEETGSALEKMAKGDGGTPPIERLGVSVGGLVRTFGGAIGVIGAVTAGVTALGLMSYRAARNAEELELRIQRVGRAGALTGKDLERFSRQLDDAYNLASGSSRKMAAELMSNTAIASNQFKATMTAAAAYASTMDGDVKTATNQVGKAMTRLASGDGKALEGAFAELSLAQRTYIQELARTGQTTQAQTALNQALTSTISEPGGLRAAFNDLTGGIYDFGVELARRTGIAQTFEDAMRGIAEWTHKAADAMRDYNEQANKTPSSWSEAAARGPTVFGAYAAGAMGLGGGNAPPGQSGPVTALPGGLMAMLRSSGLSEEIAKGVAAGIMAESGGDPRKINPDSGAYGYGQWLGSRKQALFSKYGSGGITPMEQIQYLVGELTGANGIKRDSGAASVMGSRNAAEVAYNYITEFMRPAKGKETIGDLNRAAGYLGGGARSLFGQSIVNDNQNMAYAHSVGEVLAEELRKAGLTPDMANLENNRISISQRLINDGMKPEDARTLAEQIAKAQLEAPRERAMTQLLDQLAHNANVASMNPEQAAIANAKRQAVLTLNGGDLSNGRELSGADAAKIEAEIRAEMEAKRKTAMDEYLKQLGQESQYAQMLPDELERAQAIEKARLIINDGYVLGQKEVTAELQKQIDAALDQKKIAELRGQLRVAERQFMIEQTALMRQQNALAGAAWEDKSEALAYEQRIWPLIEAAMEKGLDYAKARAEVENSTAATLARQNAALEHQNQLMSRAVDLARQNSPTYRQMETGQNLRTDRQAIDIAAMTGKFGSGAIRDQIYNELVAANERAIWENAHYFELQFVDSINNLAGYFDGKIGGVIGKIAQGLTQVANIAKGNYQGGGIVGAILGTAGSLFGSSVTDAASKVMQNAMEGLFRGDLNPKGLQSAVTDMKNMFKPGGSFTAGLGSALGIAGFGYQIGSTIGGIGSMLAPKRPGVGIGGSIGGTVGAIAGSFIPGVGTILGSVIGSALGSVVGGILGGKTKTLDGTANLGIKNGAPSLLGITGASSYAGTANSLGDAVLGGLSQIAQAIGGTLGGPLNLAISARKDYFSVDPTGRGLSKAGGAVKGFDTAEEAIAYAIKEAIRQGVITGISAASQRVLQSAKDPTSVLSAVAAYEQLDTALMKLKDPIKGAFEEFVTGMKNLRAQLIAAGYTTAELTKLEEYYQLQRAEMLKQMTQPYKDFITDLTGGPASGLSVAGQYQQTLGKLSGYEKTLRSGGTVDQGEFLKVAQLALDQGRQLYGSTTAEFQALRQRLIDDSNLAIVNIEMQSPEEMLADEIAKAGGETVNALNTTNNLLTQIRDNLAGGASGTGTGSGISTSSGSFGGTGSLGGGTVGIGQGQMTSV